MKKHLKWLIAGAVLLYPCISPLKAGAVQAAAGAAALAPKQTQTVSPSMQMPQSSTTPAQAQPSEAAPADQQAEAPQAEAAPAPLRVLVGKSILINTAERMKRVSVSQPTVADAIVVTPNQLLIHGLAPGEVTLVIWDIAGRSRSFDLRVDVDISSLKEQLKKLFADEQVMVTASRSAIVLTGHVSNEAVAGRVEAVAKAYSPNVVNALSFGPMSDEEIMLEVKFAEVDRTALSQIGINLFSTGAGNLIGQTTTQQFGSAGGFNITDSFGVPADPKPDIPVATTGSNQASFESKITIQDALNIFLFRPDIHLGTVIRALQQKNLLQILAEPNLVALDGKQASFLAGGEFPFPVVQAGGGTNAITIQFREFGVRLNFTPEITPSGKIRLKAKPEVSSLDFANALTISGFVIPALNTRKAETELELDDGQSFVIAGLMDNRVTNIQNKVPFLGDIPILGQLFRSKSFQRSNSELMVLVTAHRVRPVNGPVPLPKMPKEFLDKEKFDGNQGKPNSDGTGAKP